MSRLEDRGFIWSESGSFGVDLYCSVVAEVAWCSPARTGNAKCRQVHHNHDESEEVQPHHQSYGSMHHQNTTEPNPARPFQPNENWVTHLEQTNRNAEQRQSVFELNQKIGRDQVKWRADQ